MSTARRNKYVSAAQVAYHFSAYTFREALELGKAERAVMLSVAYAEQKRWLNDLEEVLGTTFTTQDLLAQTEDGGSATTLGARLRIPLSLAIAPELIKSLTDEQRRKASRVAETTAFIPKGSEVVEVGKMSIEEARAFFNDL